MSFLEAVYNRLQRTLTYRVLRVVSLAFLVYSNLYPRNCLDIDSFVLSVVLRRCEENVVNKSLLRLSDRRQPLASNAHCAPPLEGYWTNPLVLVGEAPT